MKRIAPEVEIIDVTHGIAPQAVLQGALILANTLPYMPAGVHLAVVDPGVGARGARSRSASGDGRSSSGPTTACCSGRRGSAGSRRRTSSRIALRARARLATFHGRDSSRRPPRTSRSGVDRGARPPLGRSALVRLDLPQPEVGDRRIRAAALRRPLREHPAQPDARAPRGSASCRARGSSSSSRRERYYAIAARTFADARAASSSSTRTRTGTRDRDQRRQRGRDVPGARPAQTSILPPPRAAVTFGQRLSRASPRTWSSAGRFSGVSSAG